MSVFVLIHSPLVGPSTWTCVAHELERRDRTVVVPPLLGIADAPAPHWRHAVDAVRAATAGIEAQLVLVGRSGAGPLLPSIAEVLTDVAALIFVDTFLPPAGGAFPLAPPVFVDRLRGLARAGVLPPWSDWFGEEAMRELVPDDALRASLIAEMPRLPLSYYDATVPIPEGWTDIACGYMLLQPDPYGETATDAHARGWPVVEIPNSHLAMVTNPSAVADALHDLELRLLRG